MNYFRFEQFSDSQHEVSISKETDTDFQQQSNLDGCHISSEHDKRARRRPDAITGEHAAEIYLLNRPIIFMPCKMDRPENRHHMFCDGNSTLFAAMYDNSTKAVRDI